MMKSQVLFVCVTCALLSTAALNFNRPSDFYRICIAIQIITMIGILIQSFVLIQIGHIGFFGALYIGALTLPHPDVWLVRTLCTVAIVTRRMFDGCLFDLITECTFTSRSWLDIIFVVPFLLSFAEEIDDSW